MQNDDDILALDFAALRTFKLVYDHCSFAAAAGELGMNPSSVSYTIQRVRRASRDPLFVKQGGAIVPTDHCHKLMKSVERVLLESENFRDEAEFEPSKASGEVKLNVTSYEMLLLFPQVVRRIRRDAPGLSLIVHDTYGSARDLLLSGSIDMYLGPQRITDSGIYGSEFVNRDHHLCMMDPANPLASKSILTLEDIRDQPHAYVEPRPGWRQAPMRYAASQGVELQRAIATSDALSIRELIIGTDLLGALPSRMVKAFSDRLALRPYDFDTGMAEHIYWTAASDRTLMHRWVRSVIEEEAAIVGRT